MLSCTFFTRKKDETYLTFFFMFALTVFLALRFGQGADYMTYKLLYLNFTKTYKNFVSVAYKSYVEPLYYLINIFFKRRDAPFQCVVVTCLLISFFFIYLTIKKYSKRQFLSVFILYANYFFYYQSALRQSLAMAIALYGVLTYINDKNIRKYLVYCFFAVMCHTAALICLAVPVFLKIKLEKIYNPVVFSITSVFCIVIGLFLPSMITKVAGLIGLRYSSYESFKTGLNIGPIGIRLFFSLLALSKYKKFKEDNDQMNLCLLKLFLLGSLLYFSLSTISIFSRLTDFLTFLEIILMPNVIKVHKHQISLVFCLSMSLYSALFVKDLYAATQQGNYYSTNPLDYPYITVFNRNRLTDYAKIKEKSPERLLNEY